MEEAHIISCRARVSGECLHGEPAVRQFSADLPMSEDGTFDGESVVCDPCYLLLLPRTRSGRGLSHELPEAIRSYREDLSR